MANKPIDYTERLKRLRQHRDPEGLEERKLTTASRKALPKGSFVFKKDRRYPIPDKSHARNALARVSQHGTPDEKARVRSAVHQKFPGIKVAHEAADLTSRNQGYVPPEEVMAPLQKLDQWTLGALQRYAAANLKSQGNGEVTPEEINQWIYTYLSYYTFDELMAEVKTHTDGAFESNNVTSKAQTLVNEVLKKARTK